MLFPSVAGCMLLSFTTIFKYIESMIETEKKQKEVNFGKPKLKEFILKQERMFALNIRKIAIKKKGS